MLKNQVIFNFTLFLAKDNRRCSRSSGLTFSTHVSWSPRHTNLCFSFCSSSFFFWLLFLSCSSSSDSNTRPTTNASHLVFYSTLRTVVVGWGSWTFQVDLRTWTKSKYWSKLKVRWYRFDTSGWMTSSTWVYHSWSLALPRLSSTWNITHTHTHHVVSESFSGRRTHRSVPASRSERVQVGRFPSAQQKRLDEFPSFHENHIKNDPLLTEQTGAENQEFESRRETPPADTPWPGQPSSTRDLWRTVFLKNGSIDLQCDIRKAHLTEVGSVLSAACRGPCPLL